MIILLKQNSKLFMNKDLTGKMISLSCGLEDEYIWEQTTSDILINFFRHTEKLGTI